MTERDHLHQKYVTERVQQVQRVRGKWTPGLTWAELLTVFREASDEARRIYRW